MLTEPMRATVPNPARDVAASFDRVIEHARDIIRDAPPETVMFNPRWLDRITVLEKSLVKLRDKTIPTIH